MPEIWDDHFWFIYKQNIGKILIGEFGIKNEKLADTSSNDYICQTLLEYLGDEASWTFWCMNQIQVIREVF